MKILVQDWLNTDIEKEFSYQYWNNRENEEEKAWNVPKFGLGCLDAYLSSSGLAEALEAALEKIGEIRKDAVSGLGVDVACGTFWSAKILLQKTKLDHLLGIDFSRHRILELGVHMVDTIAVRLSDKS